MDRPISGLAVATPPEIAAAEEKFLGGAEEAVVDEVAIVSPSETITDMEPLPVIVDNELIVGDTVVTNPAPIEPLATINSGLDITEVVVTPPTPKPLDEGGLGVVQFFAIIIFCSIVLYVIRKFNELKQATGHVPKNVPSDYMSKLL